MRKFRQKAYIWDLDVDLQGDKMTVTLKDYGIWYVYRKVFTSADIMKINPNIKLTDVFQTFEISKTHLLLRNYHFQLPVSIFVDNRLRVCYQLGSDAKVLIHVQMKNEEIVICPLQLEYFKNYTRNQIQNLKRSLSERRIIYDRYINDNNNAEIQNSANDSLYNTTRQLIKNIEGQIRAELSSQLNPLFALSESIDQDANKMRNSHHQVFSICEQARLEIQDLRQYTKNRVYFNNLVPQLASINKGVKLFQINNPFRDRFKIDGLRVHYANFISSIQPIFVFNYPVFPNQTNKIRFRIKKAPKTRFNFGFLAYSDQNGLSQVYGDTITPGLQEGYNCDDVIELFIDRSQKMIDYSVNGSLKRTSLLECLALYEYNYVPFVRFGQINQIVEFVVEQ